MRRLSQLTLQAASKTSFELDDFVRKLHAMLKESGSPSDPLSRAMERRHCLVQKIPRVSCLEVWVSCAPKSKDDIRPYFGMRIVQKHLCDSSRTASKLTKCREHKRQQTRMFPVYFLYFPEIIATIVGALQRMSVMETVPPPHAPAEQN
jgi:hypothetical protein